MFYVFHENMMRTLDVPIGSLYLKAGSLKYYPIFYRMCGDQYILKSSIACFLKNEQNIWETQNEIRRYENGQICKKTEGLQRMLLFFANVKRFYL